MQLEGGGEGKGRKGGKWKKREGEGSEEGEGRKGTGGRGRERPRGIVRKGQFDTDCFQAEGEQLRTPVCITERHTWPRWEGPSLRWVQGLWSPRADPAQPQRARPEQHLCTPGLRCRLQPYPRLASGTRATDLYARPTDSS